MDHEIRNIMQRLVQQKMVKYTGNNYALAFRQKTSQRLQEVRENSFVSKKYR